MPQPPGIVPSEGYPYNTFPYQGQPQPPSQIFYVQTMNFSPSYPPPFPPVHHAPPRYPYDFRQRNPAQNPGSFQNYQQPASAPGGQSKYGQNSSVRPPPDAFFPGRPPFIPPHPPTNSEHPVSVGQSSPQRRNPVSDSESGEDEPDLETTKEALLWPNGQQTREYRSDLEPDWKWRSSRWVWRSQGGTKAQKSVCLGVYICHNCKRPDRPRTDTNARRTQIQKGCDSCNTAPLREISCTAYTLYTSERRPNPKYNADDPESKEPESHTWLVWRHYGTHTHARPPRGTLSPDEEAKIDEQIRMHSDASAHKLRVGTKHPDSVPLGEIAPQLGDASRARYQVTKGRKRLGLTSGHIDKTMPNFLDALKECETTKWKTRFVISTQLSGGIYYMCFQTPFMRKMLEEGVESFLRDLSTESFTGACHGFVSDGDHSFFQGPLGVLFGSCVYNEVLCGWVPVLYTWLHGFSANHFRWHFWRFNLMIVEISGKRFTRELLVHCMDFSAAQKKAHAAEFAATVVDQEHPGIDYEERRRKIEKLIETATEYQQGCEFHFSESTARIRRTIPAADLQLFNDLVDTLQRSADLKEFNKAVKKFHGSFPLQRGWLDWWLQEKVARTIFAAKRTMDPKLAGMIPNTTNPIENQHSLLHHATGTKRGLIEGFEDMYLFVNEIETRYMAIKDGHIRPAEPRAPRKRNPAPYDPNAEGGRAPDTHARLAAAGSHRKPATDSPKKRKRKNNSQESPTKSGAAPPGQTEQGSSQLEPLIVRQEKRLLKSYKWVPPNSCFFDTGLELWFQAYMMMSSSSQVGMAELFAKDTLMRTIFRSFQARLQWIQSLDEKTIDDYNPALSTIQGHVRDAIFNRWNLYENGESYGDNFTWMVKAIEEACDATDALRLSIAGQFAIVHKIVVNCQACCQSDYELPKMIISIPIHPRFVVWARETLAQAGKRPTIGDYFNSYVPLIYPSPPGRKEFSGLAGTYPIHEIDDKVDCAVCLDGTTERTSIRTTWPEILHIRASDSPLESGRILMTLDFHIVGDHVQDHPVSYSLVGRSLYSKSHFTTQLIIGSRLFHYDDMVGHLREIGPATDIEAFQLKEDIIRPKPKQDPVFWVYKRTSHMQTTTRTVQNLTAHWNIMVELWLKEPRAHMDDNGDPISSSAASSPQSPTSSPFLMSCAGCMDENEDGQNELNDHDPHMSNGGAVECTKCNRWSHVQCMVKYFSMKKKEMMDPASSWECPACLDMEIWGNSPCMGQMVMAQTKSQPVGSQYRSSKFYPARVIDRVRDIVTLKWYEGNRYRNREDPTGDTFQCAPQQVISLKKAVREMDKTTKQAQFGQWLYPVQLVDSSESGYTNPAISQALDRAEPVIRQILRGERDHPIMNLHDVFQHTLVKRELEPEPHNIKMLFYALKIFPGDRHLGKDHRTRLAAEFNETMAVLADILLRLVVVRYYLERPAEDDLQIYYLSLYWERVEKLSWGETEDGLGDYESAKKGYLERFPTSAESTVKATMAKAIDDDTRDSPIVPLSKCDVASTSLIISMECPIYPYEDIEGQEYPFFAFAGDHHPYEWQDELRVPGLDADPSPKSRAPTPENEVTVSPGTEKKRKPGVTHDTDLTQGAKKPRRAETVTAGGSLPLRRSKRVHGASPPSEAQT
ncbi:hypothetical protein C8J56DRAFT_1049006 [Mycena floridula]|nr:hypothetical protein C8J56DRAFT_1049006 [Mycena floridula]